eukprot:4865894-Pyramimonas_sp.AAC.1
MPHPLSQRHHRPHVVASREVHGVNEWQRCDYLVLAHDYEVVTSWVRKLRRFRLRPVARLEDQVERAELDHCISLCSYSPETRRRGGPLFGKTKRSGDNIIIGEADRGNGSIGKFTTRVPASAMSQQSQDFGEREGLAH